MRVFSLLKQLMVFSLLTALLVGCKDDDYYDKPSWLGDPIYQYLEEQGNFTHYLACVDKTGFARTLKGTGYYTVFVPNDDAFKAFMAEHGISSLNDISAELANEIVSYSLIAVASRADQLDDYQRQVSYEERESNYNIAFKRSTFNSKGVYKYTTFGGEELNVVDVVGASANPDAGGVILSGSDINMKSIPYFTTAFLHTKQLTESDYSFFFPDTEFSGFNVVDAKVLQKDIVTENGIIHVVDKVILPLPNLEEILAETDECSDFRDIIEKYMVAFMRAPRDLELRHEQATGQLIDIYIKLYLSLHFPLNSESYLRFGGGYVTDNQINGWTMFAPTNAALSDYLENVFLAKGYKSLDEMPQFVINEMINSHLFRTAVWPSKFATSQNHFGEPARFDRDADVVKSVMGSNGFFYAVNKVQETNAFITVMRDVLLDPRFTSMYRALVSTENQFQLKNPIARQQIFLISNEQFAQLGITFNFTDNQWEHNNPNWQNLSAFNILDRLLNLHILFLPDRNKPYHNVSSGFGLIETNGGEYLRYFNGRVWASGQNISSASQITAVSDTVVNGLTYELSRPFEFTTENIGFFLETNANYRNFFRYLEKSANSVVPGAEDPNEMSRLIYNPNTKIITDISTTDNHTYLIPNNNAMNQAVTDGLLPPITVAPFSQAEQELVQRFIRFHILRRQIIFPNGGYNNIAYTNMKDSEGDSYVSIDSNTPNKLIIYDRKGRVANATATGTSAHTNVLANRAIIHLLDNYLDYRMEVVE